MAKNNLVGINIPPKGLVTIDKTKLDIYKNFMYFVDVQNLEKYLSSKQTSFISANIANCDIVLRRQ